MGSDLASNVINLKQSDQNTKHSKCFWEDDWGRSWRVLSKFVGNYWGFMSSLMERTKSSLLTESEFSIEQESGKVGKLTNDRKNWALNHELQRNTGAAVSPQHPPTRKSRVDWHSPKATVGSSIRQ